MENGGAVSGIERAVFGQHDRGEIDRWVAAHVAARLGDQVTQVLFRSGRVSPVYGLLLRSGTAIVVKVHRPPAGVEYLAAAIACQRRLADAGYPCPRPLDGPATTSGLTAVIETLLDEGEAGNAHDPSVRSAMARALHTQVQTLRDTADDQAHDSQLHALRVGAPAWSRYEHGSWPTPHDPIFDFSTTPPGWAWLDRLASQASQILSTTRHVDAVAHVDWICGNLRFDSHEVSASYDWDSLAAGPEPVLVGLSAGAFTAGSTNGDQAPSPLEVRQFLQDYDRLRARPLTSSEQETAAAAATWVMAYNARCNLSLLAPGIPPDPYLPLHAIATYRDAYLSIRW